jgi:hypothetical protein
MDTRGKIIGASQATRLAQSGATVVSGYFDPLTAPLAERLHQLKEDGFPFLVLIRTPEDAILPARARAELVAGLRVVDYVCDLEPEITATVTLELEHGEHLARLISHVYTRQQLK